MCNLKSPGAFALYIIMKDSCAIKLLGQNELFYEIQMDLNHVEEENVYCASSPIAGGCGTDLQRSTEVHCMSL